MQTNSIPESMSLGIHIFSDKYWLKYNVVIAKNISVDAAIMFGALANLSEFMLGSRRKTFIKNDFWLQVQYDFIKSRVYLSELRQRKAADELKKSKFLEISHREGNRKWVKINWEIVNKEMSKWYLDITMDPIPDEGYD